MMQVGIPPVGGSGDKLANAPGDGTDALSAMQAPNSRNFVSEPGPRSPGPVRSASHSGFSSSSGCGSSVVPEIVGGIVDAWVTAEIVGGVVEAGAEIIGSLLDG